MNNKSIDDIISKLANGHSLTIKHAPDDPKRTRLMTLCDDIIYGLLSLESTPSDEVVNYVIERIITKSPQLNTVLLVAIETRYPQYAERLKKLMVLS